MQQTETKGKHRILSDALVSSFCQQAALLLSAGVPLSSGIRAIHEDLPPSAFEEAVKEVDHEMAEHGVLSRALENSGAFPEHMVNMVVIGETSGNLDDVLSSLADYYDRSAVQKKHLKNAVMYPTVLIVMMAVIITVLIFQVLPVFERVFQQLGTTMPAAAQTIMQVGMSAGRYILIFIIAVIVLILIGALINRTKKGAVLVQNFFASFPFTKRVAEKIAVGKFTSALSLMISSGIAADEAIKIALPTIGNKRVEKKVEEAIKKIDQGTSWGNALSDADIYTGMNASLIHIGLHTGSVDQVMVQLADIYEDDVADTLDALIAAIEPAMISILAVIIGVILISVMLPLISIMSSIG